MQGHTNLYKALVIKSHQDPLTCSHSDIDGQNVYATDASPGPIINSNLDHKLLGSLSTSEILVCPLTKQSMLGNWQCAAVQKASTSITLFFFPKMYHSQDTYLDEQKIQLAVFYIIVQRLCCSSAPGVWFGCENLLDSDALALNSFASRPYCKKPNPTSQPARFSCTRIFPR